MNIAKAEKARRFEIGGLSAQIRADGSLTPSQQDEAIAAVKAEEEATLRQVLGNAAYRYFQQRSR